MVDIIDALSTGLETPNYYDVSCPSLRTNTNRFLVDDHYSIVVLLTVFEWLSRENPPLATPERLTDKPLTAASVYATDVQQVGLEFSFAETDLVNASEQRVAVSSDFSENVQGINASKWIGYEDEEKVEIRPSSIRRGSRRIYWFVSRSTFENLIV
jgi:hypothetical protein